ncbi:MAG: AraC family transcriptional regulator [Clostridiales bacterium]|nr:AraC family transcriptional regulator [Clostridiales bacterium]
MHAWEAAQKTLEYIEEHISDDVSIEDLAEIAALSPFYYQRLFSRLVKKPVREYIKLRRLARACGALRETNSRIIDIALEFGFCCHETFARSFKDTYGITPMQYRKQVIGVTHFEKPDLLLNYVMIDEGVPLISDGLVLEMNRKTLESPAWYMGKKGYLSDTHGKMLGERPGVDESYDIWTDFFKSLDEIPRISGGRRIGSAYKGDAPSGCTTFFAGIETKTREEKPRFTTWEFPAGEYIVCGFEAEDYNQLISSAISKAMKYTKSWLKKHSLTVNGFICELYYDDAYNSAYMELWIPFKQVK